MPLLAEDLVRLVRHKYEKDNTEIYNRCVVLEQVADGTGSSQRRWIDVAVFQMWEMKGLTRSAFEIKVSRQDFLQELSHPEKHQWCLDCFHEFWFVSPKEVIQLEELPFGVGWMYPRGNQLCIARHAKRNRAPRLDDVLLASFMRSAYKEIKKASRIEGQNILENNQDYKDGIIIRQALEQFLTKRGLHTYLHDIKDSQTILEKLEEATLDKETRMDRDHFLAILQEFQTRIKELFSIFAVIANRALLEKESTGEYVVGKYGGHDELALETLRNKGGVLHISDKKYLGVLEAILSWGKEGKE